MRAAFDRIRGHDESFVEGLSGGEGQEGGGSGRDMQVVYAESFAMLDDRGGRGRTVRLRAQLAAGLLRAVS